MKSFIFIIVGLAVLGGAFVYLNQREEPMVNNTPTPTPNPSVSEPPPPSFVELNFNYQKSLLFSPQSYQVKQDQTVVVNVTSDVADEVHLHGYDLSLNVAPGQPGRLEFVATATGRFDLELHETDKVIGVIEVYP